MVLITGSQGNIGSHLMDALPGSIGLDSVNRERKQDWIQCDITDYNSLFWCVSDYNFDCVLHHAAIPSVPDSYKDPMRTYINNVNGSLNLIKVCKNIGVKLVFASSSSVLGQSPYGHSKRVIEEALHHSGINYTVLRYFNVFSSRQRENIVKIMHDKLKANEEIHIFGDGSTTRDFSHIKNVIVANKKAIDGYDKMTLEVGTGKPHSLIELYKILKSKVNPDHDKLFFGPDRIGDIKYSKANTFLDEKEITHFHEGIDLWLNSL